MQTNFCVFENHIFFFSKKRFRNEKVINYDKDVDKKLAIAKHDTYIFFIKFNALF